MVSRLSILFSGGMLWEEYLDMPVIGVKHPLLGAQLLWILDYPPIKRGKHNWLVVWNLAFMTFHILGTIIPTDFHIFQRGWYTTNQIKSKCTARPKELHWAMDFPALAQLKAAIGERLLRLGRVVIWMFQEWGCSPPQVLATFGHLFKCSLHPESDLNSFWTDNYILYIPWRIHVWLC